MLKYWLPLCGDLHNQGLDEVVVTNNGATANDNGKIGKCYYFDGNAHWLQLDRPLCDFYNNDFSLAVWLKPTDSTRSIILSEYSASGASNVAFELTTARVIRVYWNGSPDINATAAGGLTLNEWSHIAIVKTNGVIKFYINGVLKYTYTGTLSSRTSNANPRIGDDYRGGTGVSYQGYMNDFRLYSHALSPKEVKELSKGLVLHYPLNRGGFGGDNLVSMSSYGRSIGGNVYPPNTNNSLVINGNKFIVTANPGDSIGAVATNIKSSEITISAKTTYTGTGRLTYRKWFDDSGNMIGSYTSERITLDNGRILGTLNVPTGATKLTFGLCYPYNAPYEVWDLKVEEGSIPTPWIPNSADVLYSSMGLDSNIEYDVSGYGNNGTITGVLNYSSNTPKYLVSTLFDGTQRILVNPITSEIKTMSAWVKTTKNKSTSQFVCADNDSRLCISFYNGCIISYLNSGGQSTGSKCTLGSSYIENDWNHIVVITTGTGTRDIYCNGVKLVPANNDYWTGYAGGFFIGARNTSQSMPFYGYISDLRVYTTALSEDDVLELYHTPASITNNGTLMTQGEIVEV